MLYFLLWRLPLYGLTLNHRQIWRSRFGRYWFRLGGSGILFLAGECFMDSLGRIDLAALDFLGGFLRLLLRLAGVFGTVEPLGSEHGTEQEIAGVDEV